MVAMRERKKKEERKKIEDHNEKLATCIHSYTGKEESLTMESRNEGRIVIKDNYFN